MAVVAVGGGRGGDFRNYSPDSSMFAFAREHNLYRREGRDEGHRPAHARRREVLQLRRARHAAGAAAAGAQPATTAAAGRRERRQGGGRSGRRRRSTAIRACAPTSRGRRTRRRSSSRAGSAEGGRAVSREQHRESASDADVVQLRDARRGERRAGRAVRLQGRRHEAHAGERQEVEGPAAVRHSLERHADRTSCAWSVAIVRSVTSS